MESEASISIGVQEVDFTQWRQGMSAGAVPAAVVPQIRRRNSCNRSQLEAAARAAFDSCADRTLTDKDWALVRSRLLEFVGILRNWERTSSFSMR